jgi:putative flippase GtrA
LPAGLSAPWRLGKQEAIQALSFSLVGTFGYIVNLSTFGALRFFLESQFLLAAVIAFLVAACCNFLLNRALTFGEHSRILHRGMRSLLTASLVLCLNLVLLYAFSEANVGLILAQAAAVLLVVPVNFGLHRYWVFG